MKKTVVLLLLSSAFFMPATSNAANPVDTIYKGKVIAQEQSAILFEMYARSLIYPESFDSFVSQNTSLFNDGHDLCVNGLLNQHLPIAIRRQQFCNGYPPYAQDQCMNQEPSSLVVLWLRSLTTRVNNGEPWCNTGSGQLACRGKLQTDSRLGYGAWKSMMEQQSLPVMRDLLICQ